jgi:NAD+ kinase
MAIINRMDHSLIPDRITVAYKPGADQEAQQVSVFLKDNGVKSVLACSIMAEKLHQRIESGQVDALIVLGGDGSMLNASHLCARAGVPILGINMGSFGFLMELKINGWQKYVSRLLHGNYRCEERMLLSAQLWHADTLKQSWEVVNEVVVCRGQQVKPIRLHASVNGYPMASYVADGLIVSTPTGSTAYALAAGGAIMPPELRNMLIVPVAPHLSLDRAIILSEGSSVTITANTIHQAVLSADGQEAVALAKDDFVKVEASQRNVTFIRFHDPGYFYRNLNRYIEQNPSTNAK